MSDIQRGGIFRKKMKTEPAPPKPAAPTDPVSRIRKRMFRNNETPTEAVEEEGGFINRAIKRRRAKTKQKALDDSAFFGMRSDGTMVDGWPIK